MNPIAQLIEAGESEKVAFKPPRATVESVAQVVCGMLNQQGGIMLWGVDPRRTVAGVRDADEKAGTLNDFLMRHLVPRPFLSVSAEKFGEKWLVLVEIPRGADKPYSLNRKIWVRVGKQDLRGSEDESARMVERSATEEGRWEREAMPGFELTDCDPTELSEARREIAEAGRFGIAVPDNDEEFLRRLYLQTSGQLTNAAMVLFATDPVAWSPNLALRIISYPSDKQSRSLHEQSLQGPAMRVLRQAVSVIQQQTGFSGRFKSGRLEREDRPAYAVYALREGLVNAIVHRDYAAVGGQLRVEIFPEHLIIQNPGRLPEGWTEKDILTRAESHPPNPDIARVFYLRSLMERLGIGGRKLDAACRALKAKPPVWKAEKGTVSLTLFRAPGLATVGQLTPRQQKFHRSLTSDLNFKADDYAKAVGVSVRQARRDLMEMEELGLLLRTGKGPATIYRLAGGGRP
jgi:ATP-dependent DNA helicase RecG